MDKTYTPSIGVSVNNVVPGDFGTVEFSGTVSKGTTMFSEQQVMQLERQIVVLLHALDHARNVLDYYAVRNPSNTEMGIGSIAEEAVAATNKVIEGFDREQLNLILRQERQRCINAIAARFEGDETECLDDWDSGWLSGVSGSIEAIREMED